MIFSPDVLANKVAVVTGSSRGIGRAVAIAFAEAGATVVIVGRNQAKCQETAEEIRQRKGKSIIVTADLAKVQQIEQLFNTVVEQCGRIDILVNNAGVALTKKALIITEEEWDQVLDSNLKSVFFCAQAAAKKMIGTGGGKIINMGSIMGQVGDVAIAPYCASKGGVVQLTKALALEWVKNNIQVNCIGPGYFLTDMNKEAFEYQKAYQHVTNNIPMGRLGQVEDIGHMTVYLASPASDYITGQSFYIDGGWTAQ